MRISRPARPRTAAVWPSLLLAALAGLPFAGAADGAAPLGYRVVASYPHDPEAFTQGLVFADGALYEGTGLRGRSGIREVDLESGAIVRSRALPAGLFGEGIAVFGARLIQLTWRAHTGFVYDLSSFRLVSEFAYPTEGWGLTSNGESLILSDGSEHLYFRDPRDFSARWRIRVADRGRPVKGLNELEFIDGQIFANVYRSARIVRVDPATGTVTGWLDLSELVRRQRQSTAAGVLNGIAYRPDSGNLLITGKRWPRLFEIELIEY